MIVANFPLIVTSYKNLIKEGTIIEYSMKEVAERLRVTRQRVYQIIETLPESQKPKRNPKGRMILDDKAIVNICKAGGWPVPDFTKSALPEATEANSKELIQVLKYQIEQQDALIAQYSSDLDLLHQQINTKDDQLKTQAETSKQQIEALNNHLKDANRITDHAQALQLDAKTKFEATQAELDTAKKQLQSLQAIETTSKEPDDTPDQNTNEKQGFWIRLFGK